jgi:putative transposase
LTGVSERTVSKLCQHIAERADVLLGPPLERELLFRWLGATDLKRREGGRLISTAATIAIAAKTEGTCEIVGLPIGLSDAESFSAFLSKA